MIDGHFGHWVRRTAGREHRRITLDDALVFGHWHRYIWERSRRLAATRFAGAVLHASELFLLYQVASGWSLMLAAAATLAFEVVGAAWWGMLEGLRTSVRERWADGRHAAIGGAVRRWLRLSVLAALPVLFAAAAMALVSSTGGAVDVAEAYVVVRLALAALDFVTRCFHAGAYAIRRVAQPTWALVLPSCARALILIGLWPLIEGWSVPAACAVGGLAAMLLSAFYVRRAYEHLGLWPLAPVQRDTAKPARRELRAALRAGAANLNAAAGHLSVLALVYFGTSDPDLWISFFVYLILVSPWLEASAAWARQFYPDWVRLQRPLLARYRAQFTVQIVRAAPVIGLAAWLPTAPLAWWAAPADEPWLFATVSALVFAARARLAALHVAAFCQRRYESLVLLAVLTPALVAAASLAPSGSDLTWLAGALAAGALLLPIPPEPPAKAGNLSGTVVTVPELLAVARMLPGPGCWKLCELAPARLLYSPQLLFRRLARRLPALAVAGDRWLLWWEVQDGKPSVPDATLQGIKRRYWKSAPSPSAIEALEQGFPFGPVASLPSARSAEALMQDFLRRFPSGICVPAGECAPASLHQRLGWRERKAVLDAALAHAHGRPPPKQISLDVSAFTDRGELAILFFAPRGDSLALRDWRRRLRGWSLAHAMHARRPDAAAALRLAIPAGGEPGS